MTFKDKLDEALNQAAYYMGVPGAIEEYFREAEPVRDEIVDTTRWGILHSAVYKYEGRYWAVDYEEPATEMQDWEKNYVLFEVEPVEKTVIDYVRKDK